MGGEWLFWGVEAKTFAYALILLSFAAAFRGQRWRVAGFGALATYFHFLVGGFWVLWALALHLYVHRDWRSTIKGLTGYAVAVLPMVVLVAIEEFSHHGIVHPAGMPTADYIYSIIRHPHHTAPFSVGKFLDIWLPKALVFALIFPVAASMAVMGRSRKLKAMAWLVAGLSAYLWLALGISWFDRHTGHLGKFYLFRSGAMSLLLAFILVSVFRCTLRKYENDRIRIARQAVMVIVAIWAIKTGILGGYLLPTLRYGGPPKGLDAKAIRQVANKDDVILVEPSIDRAVVPRLLDRPTLVNDKFIPTNPADIYRWYSYMQWRDAFFKSGCGDDLHWIAPVKFILIPNRQGQSQVVDNCGPVVWSNDRYALIRVRHPAASMELKPDASHALSNRMANSE